MATNGNPDSDKRKKRSTRMGILLLVALAVIVIAVIWGVQRWSEDDMRGPSVSEPPPSELVAQFHPQAA